VKWLFLFVGIVVICFVVALVLGLAGGGLGRTSASLSHEPLPDEPIGDADFDDLVFDVAARGYRMSQVDGVIDRLRRELREKDEEIAVLRGEDPAALRDPSPGEPFPGEPDAGETEPREPEPSEPESSEPEPSKPRLSEPERDEPEPDEPDPGDPSEAEPSRADRPGLEPSEVVQRQAEPSDPTVGRERTT
jgi:hypothetical protein